MESNNKEQDMDLQKLVNEVQRKKRGEIEQEAPQDDPEQIRRIDILNLPPRTEIHSKYKKRTHVKFSRPLLRLLMVIIVLAGVFIGAYFIWREGLLTLISNL